MKKVLFLALASVAISSPALAQDSGSFRTYVGILGGYDSVELEVDGETGDKGDLAYAGLIGIQTDMGSNAIVGLEAELGDSQVSTSASNFLEDGDRVKLSAGRDIYVGAKIGFRATPSLIAYAKGGYTNVRAKGSYTDATGTYREHINNDGYRIGAGVEFGTGPLHLVAEYRYSDYGNFKYDDLDLGIEGRRSQVMAGVTYGF